MKHALVVGGTGMLAKVSLWLLDQGYHVSIVARNRDRMNQLMEKTHLKSYITPLLVDYRNNEALKEQVNRAIQKNGQIDLVVAWIHSIAKDALHIIANEVSITNHEWELFHVLGSSVHLNHVTRKAAVPVNCVYYQVQLGYIDEGTYSRWLTHDEISAGVIEAIENKKQVSTIGQIEPWDKRP